MADSRPSRRAGCWAASRVVRSSTWLLVWATMMQLSPPAASSAAVRTTKVVFPAPGGESTITPRWPELAISARTSVMT